MAAFENPNNLSGLDLYRSMLKTPEGRAHIDDYHQWVTDEIQRTEAEAMARTGGGFLGSMEKVMSPVMDKVIKYGPYVYLAAVGASAAAGAMGGAGAGAAGAGAAGEGAAAGLGAGALEGAGTAGAVGGATAAEGGLGAALGAGASEAIPQVIVSGSAAGAGGAGAGALGSVGGAGLTLADAMGGSPDIGNYESALPQGQPIEGTEGNDYPTTGNDNPVFSNSGGTDYWSKLQNLFNNNGNNSSGNNLGSVLGGLSDYFNSKYDKNYYGNVINKLNTMYTPGSPEEQLMRQKIEAQDAASGRRSQYGIREQNLAGMLNQQRANIMTSPIYSGYLDAYTGRRSDQNNSLLAAMGSMNGGGSSNNIGSTLSGMYNLYNNGSKLYNGISSLFG